MRELSLGSDNKNISFSEEYNSMLDHVQFISTYVSAKLILPARYVGCSTQNIQLHHSNIRPNLQ
jgi:hypothetical protein